MATEVAPAEWAVLAAVKAAPGGMEEVAAAKAWAIPKAPTAAGTEVAVKVVAATATPAATAAKEGQRVDCGRGSVSRRPR